MTDLTMAKVKQLYQDMVAMEQNVITLEKRTTLRVALLERRTTHELSPSKGYSSRSGTLKTIVMAASIAFGLGVSVSSGSDFRMLLAGIPIGLGIAWAFVVYLEWRKANQEEDTHTQETRGPVNRQMTKDDFIRVCLSNRIGGWDKDACEDVILGGLSIEDTAKKYKMFPRVLASNLEKFR